MCVCVCMDILGIICMQVRVHTGAPAVDARGHARYLSSGAVNLDFETGV